MIEADRGNYGTAAPWFTSAASHRLTYSQVKPATLYSRGRGVERDLGEAFKWLGLAAKKRNLDARKHLTDVARLLNDLAFEFAEDAIRSFVAEP